MSTMTLKPRSAARPAAGLGHVGLPQVNLLPPEVRAARALRHVKKWLAVSLLVVLACLVAVYALAVLSKGAATEELSTAQAEQVRLQEEAKTYEAVVPVLSDLDRTTTARATMMSAEIVWKQYVDAIAAVLPQGAVITTFNVSVVGSTGVTPVTGLQTPGVASISFSATVPSMPDSAAWIDALNGVPGFYGATTSTDSLQANDAGEVGYNVTTTVQIAPTAYAHRFAAPAPAGASTDGN